MTVTVSARKSHSPAGITPPPVVDVRPFLKWAGGKRQLLPVLREFYPARFGTYFEPFVGSGAVFFDLVAKRLIDDHPVVLSDVNRDVIGCYQALRRNAGGVIRSLRSLERGYVCQGVEHYYAIRDRRFNPWRDRLLASASGWDDLVEYPAPVAAMLIYLNRTGYNGLFRLNRRGHFNVPAGRYDRPCICDAPNLRAVARSLARPGLEVHHASFERILDRARAGDFVYFDPPYAPVSSTARFTSYTADGFGVDDHRRLQHVVVELAVRGCQVLLSNSAVPVTAALYETDPQVRAAGLSVWRVPARRAINVNASGRGPVLEFLVSNIQRGEGNNRAAWVLGVN